MPNLLSRRTGSLEYLNFPNLPTGKLRHGVFNRRGGFSRSPYNSLNVSQGVGDDSLLVARNRGLIKVALGINVLVSARQIHGDRVLLVDTGVHQDFEADGYDALITRGNAGLMIQQADCQAVIIFDPETPSLALAHVGWRGNVGNTVGATVGAMVNSFGSVPAKLRSAISPSLGSCCGEFVDFRRELPTWMHEFQVRPNYFDFPAITSHQLQEAGLLRENICSSGICTRCNPAYFSYRRSGITGRFATVATLVGQV